MILILKYERRLIINSIIYNFYIKSVKQFYYFFSVYDVLDEHNYYKKEEDDSDDLSEAVLVIGRPGN